eukprot:3936952-Rhodomonas_salina.5
MVDDDAEHAHCANAVNHAFLGLRKRLRCHQRSVLPHHPERVDATLPQRHGSLGRQEGPHRELFAGDRQQRQGSVIVRLVLVLWEHNAGGGRGPQRHQRFAVDFAARGHRHAVQELERGRNHVLGKHARELSAKSLSVPACLLRGVEHDEGNELAVEQEHRTVADDVTVEDRRFDLSDLHPHAPDLDLRVDAAEELHTAVGQPPAQVTGAVQTMRCLCRVLLVVPRNELLERELWALELARHSEGDRLQELVQDQELHARERVADRSRIFGVSGAGKRRDDVGLRGAVLVAECSGGGGPAVDESPGHRLAGNSKSAESRPAGRRRHDSEVARGDKENADGVFGDEGFEAKQAARLVHHHQRSLCAHAAPYLIASDVEGQRGLLSDAVAVTQSCALSDGNVLSGDSAMGNHHTLGEPSGAGCVDHGSGVGASRRGLGPRINLGNGGVDGFLEQILSNNVARGRDKALI